MTRHEAVAIKKCDGIPVESLCNECDSRAAVFCDSCASMYCHRCWERSHSAALPKRAGANTGKLRKR